MTVDIRFSRTAAKALLRCGKRALVREKIDQLSTEPLALSANVKKLQGRPEYRLRVQDWRIIFRMEGDILCLDDIAPRAAARSDDRLVGKSCFRTFCSRLFLF